MAPCASCDYNMALIPEPMRNCQEENADYYDDDYDGGDCNEGDYHDGNNNKRALTAGKHEQP